MTVAVPHLVGLGRTQVEAKLNGLLLRHIARFPFSADGDGRATEQSPAAGTSVRQYSVVTVSYPSPLGPQDDSPIEGPTLNGTLVGRINSVLVDRDGASIGFANGHEDVSIVLYLDQPVPLLLPRAEWMRRGAMLSVAQRAFTNAHSVRIVVADTVVQSIEIFKP